MSAYDNDPRVEQGNSEYVFMVFAPDDTYTVSAWKDAHDWLIDPALGSRAMRDANLRTREDADAFTARTVRGPFPSADDAIRSLIGDPQ